MYIWYYILHSHICYGIDYNVQLFSWHDLLAVTFHLAYITSSYLLWYYNKHKYKHYTW